MPRIKLTYTEVDRVIYEHWKERRLATKKRDAEHQPYMRLARIRDDYTCKICHYKSKSNHVHHIGNWDGSVSHLPVELILTHLITLCPGCHCKAEMGHYTEGCLLALVSGK